MKVEIKKTLSGKYWGIYVQGKTLPVVSATTKAECEEIFKKTMKLSKSKL